MNKSEKRARLREIVAALKEVYPTAECALQYGGDPWRLLVMGRLSAQCTDARVNIVCKDLFAVYPDAAAMAAAPVTDIERLIRPCGLYHTKAESLRAASARLMEQYGGTLPDTMEELLTLPGVGRKIANLLLGDIYHRTAVVADTHCIRICGRLGMYPETVRDPVKTESVLLALIDGREASDFCHRIVMFGREYCTARAPHCAGCPLAARGLCEHKIREDKRGERKDNRT